MHKVTLIISVYNKVKELELIFYALTIQSYNDFEVIIAEDGRNEHMEKFIHDGKLKNIIDIVHITQSDKGFRKNRILNKAIRHSSTDYLIFIDGDCIPHSDFIRAHYENIEVNTVLCGRRVNLTKNISDKLTKENILNLNYQKIKFSEILFSSMNKNMFNFNIEESFIYKNNALRKVLTNENEHILGCNFSLSKNLIESINGFDENYIGPGLGEDSDIEFRLRLNNTRFNSVRNLAVQYHIYHKKTIEASENMEYFNLIKKKREYFCRNGLV